MIKGGMNTASMTHQVSGIRLNGEVYGKTVRLMYGLCTAAPDLVWYNDWKAIDQGLSNQALYRVTGQTTENGKKASKKSDAKYYSANVDLLIGHAPVLGVMNIWYQNHRLQVVLVSATGYISGGQFTFVPHGGDSKSTVDTVIPETAPYQVSVPSFVANYGVLRVGTRYYFQDIGTGTPGPSQYTVDDAGNYTFSNTDAGKSVEIVYYRMSSSGTTGLCAGVFAATVHETFDVTFTDFGGPGVVHTHGTWERTLWNARFAEPGNISSSAFRARDPYSFWVNEIGTSYGGSVTVNFPSQLNGKAVTVYYGVPMINNSDGSFYSSTITPLQLMKLEFESKFGTGAEYTKHPDQRVEQEWCVGLGGVNFDLGMANAVPNMNMEVIGAFTQWPNGDCDVVDVLTDIVTSGPIALLSGSPGTPTMEQARGIIDIPYATLFTPFMYGCRWWNWTAPELPGDAQIVALMGVMDMSFEQRSSGYQSNAVSFFNVNNMQLVDVGLNSMNVAGSHICGPFQHDSYAGLYGTGENGANRNYKGPANLGTSVADLANIVAISQNEGTYQSPNGCKLVTNSVAIAVIFTTNTGAVGNLGPNPLPPGFSLEGNEACVWVYPQSAEAGVNSSTNPIPAPTITLATPASGIGTPAIAAYSLGLPHGLNCNDYDNGGALDPSFPPGNGKLLGDMFPMNAWCRANSIHVALNQDSQRSGKDMCDELATIGNSAPVYSGRTLKMIPYDEVSAAGNGAYYFAPTSGGPIADLTDQDFASVGGEIMPVKCGRKRRTDCDNVVSIEHLNRVNDYSQDVTSEPYHCGIALYGPRKGGTLAAAELGQNLPSGSKALRAIHDKEVAQKVSSILAKRGGIGVNTYEFVLKAEWIHLEAMDLVSLTDTRIGLNKVPVRLQTVSENEDHTLNCTAEQFVYGLNHPEVMTPGSPSGTLVDVDVSPGSINTPIIFQPPTSMSNNQMEVWTVVSSGDIAYGGAVVWMSIDGGESYQVVGTVGVAVTGKLTAEFPTNNDPDITNALQVDVSESRGALTSVTQAAADALSDPRFLEGSDVYHFEIVCPTVATMTDSYVYEMDTYIRRGCYATLPTVHAADKRFAVLDGAVAHIPISPTLVGTILHFKFASFNKVGGQQTPLDECTDYTYTVIGVPVNFTSQMFLVNGG